MEELVVQGKLVASEFVIQELGVKGDPLFNWANNQKPLRRMCCNFAVEPKDGVDDRKFSSSQRTDRE